MERGRGKREEGRERGEGGKGKGEEGEGVQIPCYVDPVSHMEERHK